MKMFFSQSSRKHKIAKGRALEVIASTIAKESINQDDFTELFWEGTDFRGVNLHVVGIVKPDRQTGEPIFLIIHVMPDYGDGGEDA